MQSTPSTTISVAALLISGAVLLGSLHMTKALDDHKAPQQHDDSSIAKISVDLHHHSDKASQTADDQSTYIDGRSLKLHRNIKQKSRGLQWLQDWWQLHGLSLG